MTSLISVISATFRPLALATRGIDVSSLAPALGWESLACGDTLKVTAKIADVEGPGRLSLFRVSKRMNVAPLKFLCSPSAVVAHSHNPPGPERNAEQQPARFAGC